MQNWVPLGVILRTLIHLRSGGWQRTSSYTPTYEAEKNTEFFVMTDQRRSQSETALEHRWPAYDNPSHVPGNDSISLLVATVFLRCGERCNESNAMCGTAKKGMGMLIVNQMMRLRRPTGGTIWPCICMVIWIRSTCGWMTGWDCWGRAVGISPKHYLLSTECFPVVEK